MITVATLLVIVLSACLLLAARSRSGKTKLIAELVAGAALTVLLLFGGTSLLPSSAHLPSGFAGTWAKASVIAWWFVAARLAAAGLSLLLGLGRGSKQVKLLTDLVSATVYVSVIMVVLNGVLGLQIGGLIATSGLVAVVIGLALQSTLADLFSGIAVGLEQPFHIGDRLALASGLEGTVTSINWRAVRIRTEGNDIVTVPNSLVAKSYILNRTAVSEQRGSRVEITTSATTPSRTVSALLQDAVFLTPGVLDEPSPEILLIRLGQRTATYAVDFRVANSLALLGAKSRLLAQIQRQIRYAGLSDGIQLPASALLKSLVLFENLGDAQIGLLEGGLARHAIDSGAIMFGQGDRGTSLYIIARGVVQISRNDASGREATLGRIGPGEYIGEIGLITGDPRPVTARALSRSDVYELSREFLQSLVEQSGTLGAALQMSVERGMQLLERDTAAREGQHPREDGTFAERLRSFFHKPKSTEVS